MNRFTVSLALVAGFCVLLCAAQSTNNDDVVNAFGKVRGNLYSTVVLFDTSGLHDPKPHCQGLEGSLLQIAKDLDSAITTMESFKGTLGRSEQLEVSHYVVAGAGDAYEIYSNILSFHDRMSELGLTYLFTRALRTFQQGFDQLITAAMPYLDNDVQIWTGSSAVDTICTLDKTATLLDPSSPLTNKKFCDTYAGVPQAEDPSKNDNGASLGPAPPFPTFPDAPSAYADCDRKCSNVLKFGYESGCFDNPDKCKSLSWCSTVGGVPFTPCTPDWLPNKLFCY